MKTKCDRMGEFNDLCTLSNDDTLSAFRWMDESGFLTAPASTKYHGNYEGGLFDHSLEVAKRLMELTENNNLTWSRVASPFIVGMFHDVCKADQYCKNDSNEVFEYPYEYAKQMALTGHGDKSVMVLSTVMRLTPEEVLCIRYHMGAFSEKEEWKDYTNAIHLYPNVLWTHQADMLAAHVSMV